MRHRKLHALGLSPLSDESESTKAAMILVCAPLMFLFLAYTEWRLVGVYYNGGHPWARIFKQFKCNQPAGQNQIEDTSKSNVV